MSLDYSKSAIHRYEHAESYTHDVVDESTLPPTIIHTSGSSKDTHLIRSSSAQGYKNPNWKYQVAHLQDATTTFVGVDVSDDPAPFISFEESGTYRHQVTGKTYSYKTEGSWTGTAAVSPPSVLDVPGNVAADVRNRCIRKFLQAIDAAQSSFESGQDLGEWKQTVEAVRHPLDSLKQSVLDYIGALKRKRAKYLRHDRHLRKVLADTYLEFHFGWMPLVADIASGIADLGRFRFPVIPLHATASLDYARGESTSFGGYNAPVSRSHSYKETSRYTVRYKGVLRPKNLGSDGRLSILQALQLTPDKWLPTAWDLIPYSWMTDYFVNIGEIIAGVSALASVDIPWGVVTTRHQITRQYGDVTVGDEGAQIPGYDLLNHVHSSHGGACSTWMRQVTRSPLIGSDLIPTLQFSLPTRSNQFANIASVLNKHLTGLTPFY